MKLTKKLEVEIKALMDDYWNSYLTGDLKRWGNYLPDNYRNIGGTKEEIWNTKKEILDYTKAIADQMVGMAALRNKTIQIISYDPYFMVHEFMDMFIKVDGKFTFYGKFRLSSLIEQTTKGWKVLHQHGSYPDSKTEEGEAFAFDEIKAENIKLKDAVQRRTIELEEKNRELEIETSLEKVRAVAMGMQQQDDMLAVCEILFHELKSLGFDELRNTMIHSFPEGKEYFINYDYSSAAGSQIVEIPRKGNPQMEKFIKAIRKSGDAFQHLAIKGKELKDWIAFRQANKEPNDPQLNKTTSLNYYNYAVGDAGIGISTYGPIEKEKQELLQRFKNVFQLAYQRYTDITLAEAQVREAQIEASLERVRSHSLAMHNTSELQEVIHTVHKELLNLNIAINGGSFIAINSDIDTTLRCWGSGGTADTTGEINIPLYKKPFCTNLINHIKKGPGFFTEAFTQKEKKDFFTFLFKHEPWKNLKAKDKNEMLSGSGGYTRSCFVSKHTSIFIINHFGEHFSAADNDILQRFGKVFEQSYTRFLDLQKAEASAREAQIEAAVERVRAEAMAMHSTSDFEIVVKQLLQQIQHLNLEGFTGAQIILIDEKEFITVWDCSSPGNMGDPKSATIRYDAKKFPIMGVEILDKLKEGKSYFVMEFDLKKLRAAIKEWKKINVTIAGVITDAIAGGHLTHQWDACGRLNNGMIAFDMIKPPDDDVRNITIKMTHAFEQAYTRFLDLQKAEAQAKEARIEAALERVRARTMAMQHSNELLDAATLLFQQIELLGASSWNCSFNIWDEHKKQATAWNGFKDGFGRPFVSNSAEDVFLEFYKGSQKKEKLFIKEIGGTELKNHYKYLSTLPGVRETLAELKAADVALPTFQIFHIAYFAQGYLMFITYKPVPEFHDIFKRFANVFEQTYTRFIDLQKAEAQAREAEIELALERIRARTMAMQHSDELADASLLLDQQVRALGIKTRGCAFNIYGEKESTEWFSNEMGTMQTYKTPREKVFLDYYDAGQKGETLLIKEFSGNACVDWYNYLCTLPVIGDGLKEMIANGGTFPTRQIDHVSFFKYGYLLFLTFEPVPEAHDIFIRFAKVFEQTYTRFLDLQKAEAQTREAQINLAVERVRARALAMFKSDEILEVVFKLKEEVMNLNIPGVAAATIHLKEKNGMHRMWDLSSFEQDGEKMHLPLDIIYKLEESDPNFYIRKIWGNAQQYFLVKQDKKDLKITTDWLRSNGKVKQADEADQFINSVDFTFLHHPTIQLNNGRMSIDLFDQAPSEEIKSILTKMGAAFDLAYKRFEDLKNSEAQLKEAQIEAALEKVRSRSLAMHKSDEIGEVVWTVVERMKELKVELNGISLVTYIPDSKDTQHWHVNPEIAGNSSAMLLPYFDDLICKDCNEAKEKGIELLAKVYTKEQKDSYFNKAVEVSDFKYFPEELKQWVLDQPCLSFSFAIQNHSGIFLEDYAGKIFSKEDNDILIRFSRVFEQSYVRFLDLQKAETQSRENKIQLALERARTQSMIMQHSTELDDTLRVFHEQILLLGINSAFSFLWLPDEEKSNHIFWAAWQEGVPAGDAGKDDSTAFKSKAITYPLDREEPATAQCLLDWRSDEAVHSYAVKPSEVDNYFAAWAGLLDGVDKLKPEFFRNGLYYVEAFMKYGCFGVMLQHDLSGEEKNILYRFSIEFERTYTRFLDLQKAEAQALRAEHDLLEIKVARQKAEEALTNLQAAQKQLIQSEKMASLGELTAGIAHEIQNPLNFVNNFSEVSKELLDEIKEEIEKGNFKDAMEIMEDVIQNLEKINHHGKRADDIVKGMLQHSRSSSGVKEATDINALCDEYLRLSYHGLRAKDKSFNATMKTDFDNSLGNINIIPQDIGRVILNLINNAFYAVDEKNKSGVENYEPTVSISTKKSGDKVEINVSDNGGGISDTVKHKIFQPFFTTKPTGQGTGLGLSLSYDIIKAHGGELLVESKVDKGSKFIIHLPDPE